ncbi:TPA: hypothetical protein ACNFRD_001437 [Citrobacter freundii]
MTTNHPAHGPVSLERLHQISEILSKASAQSDGGNLGYAMADAVKVIDGAIAVFGAEPVEFLPDNLDRALTILGVALPISKEEFNLDAERWMQRLINRVIRLESELIPPAPAVPEWTNEECLEFISIAFRHAEIKGDLELDDIRLGVKMVNDGRAAILQAGNHTEQRLDMVEHSGEANKMVVGNYPVKISLRNGIEAIRNSGIPVDFDKIQSECDAGNSPVTPDGYVLVPKVVTPEIGNAINEVGLHCTCGNCSQRLWDLLLAAAPQQEVKNG